MSRSPLDGIQRTARRIHRRTIQALRTPLEVVLAVLVVIGVTAAITVTLLQWRHSHDTFNRDVLECVAMDARGRTPTWMQRFNNLESAYLWSRRMQGEGRGVITCYLPNPGMSGGLPPLHEPDSTSQLYGPKTAPAVRTVPTTGGTR